MAIFAKICKNRQILKALIFKGFERYLRCIFATTSMCVVHGNWSTGVASMNSYPLAVRYFISLASVPGSQDT